MLGVGELETVDIKFAAAPDCVSEICFEPVGTTITLHGGQFVYLRTPLSAVSEIEIVVWESGIGVWVPYPGDYSIISSDGVEIDKL